MYRVFCLFVCNLGCTLCTSVYIVIKIIGVFFFWGKFDEDCTLGSTDMYMVVLVYYAPFQAGVHVYRFVNGGTEIFDDERVNSLDGAKKLAISDGLEGVVSKANGIFRNPTLVREIKESNIPLLTYGKLK
ncbi:putative glycerophosphodiester phosphodiesterase [Helianthus annuus]|nr:putative glycerophosphodiester phosphodiesterase [Helianthus annuus]